MLHGFSIHGFGSQVAILLPTSDACRVANEFLLPFLPRAAPDPANADAVIRISHDEHGMYRLHSGQQEITTGETLPRLLPLVQSILDGIIVRRLTDRVAVHAGVVAYKGALLMFPGASYAGKSSLVAEFLRRGLSYYSDEYALIDREGCVHPYPRLPLLRQAGPPDHPAAPGRWDGAIAQTPGRAAFIFGITYSPGEVLRMETLPQSEMLVLLLKNTPHELRKSSRILQPLLRVTSAARCFAGIRGEAVEAAGRLLELVDRS